MTSDEIKTKIAKLNDKDLGTLAPSIAPTVKGAHALEIAMYEIALQGATIADRLQSILEIVEDSLNPPRKP